MSEDLSPAVVLAAAAVGGSQKHPVTMAIAATRAGKAPDLVDVDPLILVDTIRFLAILGEAELVDRAYAHWAKLPNGNIHFEAALASLMAGDLTEADLRLRRALTVPEPQPMAWNSLAILRLKLGDFDGALQAIEDGVRALPDDALMQKNAVILRRQKLGATPDTDVMALIVLCERFPGHAALAREAADFMLRVPDGTGLDVDGAMALLLQRAEDLDPRGVGRQPGESQIPRLIAAYSGMVLGAITLMGGLVRIMGDTYVTASTGLFLLLGAGLFGYGAHRYFRR